MGGGAGGGKMGVGRWGGRTLLHLFQHPDLSPERGHRRHQLRLLSELFRGCDGVGSDGVGG